MAYIWCCFGVAWGSELRRMVLPRTPVYKECKGLQRMSLNAQGEAVAEAVAGVAKTVFSSGAGTVFSSGFSSGAGTGFSTVTVRAAGRGEAASSRSPMRSRRAQTRSPISSPTASTIRSVMASPLSLLTGLTLLLPTIPSLHSCRTRSCPAPWSFRSRCSHRVATPRISYTPHSPGPMPSYASPTPTLRLLPIIPPVRFPAVQKTGPCWTGATRSSENAPSRTYGG